MKNTASSPQIPSGIGGWLLIPLSGLFLSPISVMYDVVSKLIPTFRPEIWGRLTSESSSIYHPMWVPLYIFQIIGNLFMLLGSIALIILLFRRKKVFPKLIITFYIIAFIFLTANFLCISSFPVKLIPAIGVEVVPGLKRDLVSVIVSLFIWVPYFLKSERVKNTFIN